MHLSEAAKTNLRCGGCGACHNCHLYATDLRYRWLWDGKIGPQPTAKAAPDASQQAALKWSIGVTTAPRGEATLSRTLASLAAVGFSKPRIFADGPCDVPRGYAVTRRDKVGGWPNFWLTLTEMISRTPQADLYAIVQDDVVFCPGLRRYLERLGFPADAGFVSPFTPAVYNREPPGWNKIPCGYGMTAAQTVIFPREAAYRFLQDEFVVNHRRKAPGPSRNFRGDGLHHIDGVLGEFCQRTGLKNYFHSPSLAQHIGTVSAMYPEIDRSAKMKRIFADTFLGGTFDLLQPLVCAVMITGKDPSRRPLALEAIRDFQMQTYAPRKLLIINDSGAAWFPDLTGQGSAIVEHVVKKRHTLGELRQKGIWLAGKFAGPIDADMVIQWDDDDLYGPERITYQVSKWRPGCAVVLKSQMRRDETDGREIRYSRERGIEGTILHEVVNAPKYPAQGKSEDTAFRNAFPAKRLIVADNDPALYVRRYHGGNTWDRKHIMGVE